MSQIENDVAANADSESRQLRFDLAIVGGTAPGIFAAVRAAREGLDVALISPTRHLGGSLPSLGAVETHYHGVRAPLLQEFLDRIQEHYRMAAGSEADRVYRAGSMVTFEPHVAESILEAMTQAEPGIRVFREFLPDSMDFEGREIREVRFRSTSGDSNPLAIRAGAWIEAGYEGDFLALAGVRCRIGRESHAEFLEPRAGQVFTRWLTGIFPRAAAEGKLNLVTARATTSEPLPGSSGEGDREIQSYSYRLCLTDDPANRLLPESPPPGYDRSRYMPILLDPQEKEKLPLPFHHRFLIYSLREMIETDHLFHGHALPNRKRSWNATNLTGGGRDYPTAGSEERRKIEQIHRSHALGLLFFLQNDPAVPADIRELAREWGLARDEFADTGHVPPQLYIREARRMVGRHVFTEHDALAAQGSERAPVHPNSIGITEFSLDSLACTNARLPGSLCDGQLFQMEVSRPGQVPFGVLLPVEFDNLLAVTTVSATHVAWGSIRQTPTLMHLAESAAWAVVLARHRRCSPANLPVVELQETLACAGVMLTFFNDLDMSGPAPLVAAMQILGAHGFFDSYDAHPHNPLLRSTARRWVKRLAVLRGERDRHSSTDDAEAPDSSVSPVEFATLLGPAASHLPDKAQSGRPITRGEAALWIHQLLRQPSDA